MMNEIKQLLRLVDAKVDRLDAMLTEIRSILQAAGRQSSSTTPVEKENVGPHLPWSV